MILTEGTSIHEHCHEDSDGHVMKSFEISSHTSCLSWRNMFFLHGFPTSHNLPTRLLLLFHLNNDSKFILMLTFEYIKIRVEKAT